jgi:Flagellar biosynthesis protein, FliO
VSRQKQRGEKQSSRGKIPKRKNPKTWFKKAETSESERNAGVVGKILHMSDPGAAKWVHRCLAMVRSWWRGRPVRQLRVRETLALGERRFVAVVEFEGQRFLIGGTNHSLTLLAQIPPERERLLHGAGRDSRVSESRGESQE